MALSLSLSLSLCHKRIYNTLTRKEGGSLSLSLFLLSVSSPSLSVSHSITLSLTEGSTTHKTHINILTHPLHPPTHTSSLSLKGSSPTRKECGTHTDTHTPSLCLARTHARTHARALLQGCTTFSWKTWLQCRRLRLMPSLCIGRKP